MMLTWWMMGLSRRVRFCYILVGRRLRSQCQPTWTFQSHFRKFFRIFLFCILQFEVCYFIYSDNYQLTFSVECDSRIFVREDDAWSMKGHYSQAVQLQENVPWERDSKGKLVISILAISLINLLFLNCHSWI